MNLQELFEEANGFRNNGKITEAVKAYQQVIGEALKHDKRELAAEASHMIGCAYYIDEQYDLAQDYFLEALEQFKRLNNNLGWGSTLRDMGSNAQRQGRFEEAKDYFHNSIYQLKQTDNWSHIGMSQVKLGLLFSQMNEMEKAEESIKEGLLNILKVPNSFFGSTAYFDLAKLEKKMGRIEEAKMSAKKGLEILDKVSNREQFQRRRKEIEEFLISFGTN